MCAVLVVAVSCRGSDSADQPAGDTTTAALPPAPVSPAGPTDAEIAHIVVTANTIDIEAAEQASQKAQNAEVKQFARTMITDHTAVNQQAGQLAQSLSLTPSDNAVSQQLKTQADSAKANLATMSGAGFDRAYIGREVAYHQAVLNALDQTLIPAAQNAQLKALLEQSRPAFAAHLQAAQQLQTKLGS
ncbi:MAG: DUF4142 domain-containing protein [Longimicrobiales bacterium]